MLSLQSAGKRLHHFSFSMGPGLRRDDGYAAADPARAPNPGR